MSTHRAMVRGPWGPVGTLVEVPYYDPSTEEPPPPLQWHVNRGHLLLESEYQIKMTGEAPVEVEEQEMPAGPDYPAMTVAQLREEIASREEDGRDIVVHEPGNKPEIIAALEDDDANYNTGVVGPDQGGSEVP